MAKKTTAAAVHGEKMIQLTVRLWTNNIAAKKNTVRQRNAWTGGVVKLERNPTHGIRSGRPVVFRSLLEIGVALEKALISGSIKLHPSAKTRRYLA